MDQTAYRKIFRDIVKGWSEAKIDDQLFYIKHLSSLDQVDIDEIKENYYQSAISRGIPSQSELLEDLKKDGLWDDAKDLEITKQENFIDSLRKAKTQLVLKSQIDEHNKAISKAEEKISLLRKEKADIMGVNAEDYSEKRSNDYYIIKSFYEDKDLTNPLFGSEQDFDELYAEDIYKFIDVYNKTFKMFEELNIQKMILQDFYYIYFPFSDDTVGFFGNPVCHLTYNQLKLIVYTKIFKNIFERNSHIPEKIKKDPQALLDYGSISDEAKSKMEKQLNDQKDGSTLFGATAEDYEYAGLRTEADSSKMSLQKAAEKKGGSLSMKDLMELSGLNSK